MENIKEFQKILKKQKIDLALLFANDPNMIYLNSFNDSGIMMISQKKPPLLLIPEMEHERAKIFSATKKILKITKNNLSETILNATKNFLKIKKLKKIGLNNETVSVSRLKKIKKIFKKAKFCNIGGYIEDIRQTKTKKEIANIRKACIITGRIMSLFIKNFKRFKTEQEATLFLINQIISNGCEPSFEPIVGSGANSSLPHYNALKHSNTRIKKGFCIIDFGVKYRGYCSDMTRTIYYGNPSKKEIKDYNNVLQAQKKAISSINKNITYEQLFSDAKKALGKRFIHSLGHGIGIEIHEKPSIYLKNKQKIAENSVFAIEPAVYEKGKYGIRIEDDVFVKKNKKKLIPVVLTKNPKDLVIIN